MKKRFLCILLTVVMLIGSVSTFMLVSSADTGSSGDVYEVTDAASITALIADTTKNVIGNTMKLTQNLTYDASENSLWANLNLDVDGNGHQIILKGGVYNPAVLFKIVAGTTENMHTQVIKNLAIVMETPEAKATCDSSKERISLFAQNPENVHLMIENCYFNVNFEITGSAKSNNGIAILISRYFKTAALEITVKNSFLKANLQTPENSGQSGGILGRRWGEANQSPLKINIENFGFDVTNHTKAALVGDYRSQAKTVINATGKNLIFNDAKIANGGTYAGFDLNVTNKGIDTDLTLGDAWTYTTTGFPMPKALVQNGLIRVAIENTAETHTVLKGYQTTKEYMNSNDQKVFDLRLIGVLSLGETTLADYSKVGFKVVANYGYSEATSGISKANQTGSDTVYSGISANNDTNTKEYTAAELGGDYIFALVCKNIPIDAGMITFEVTPYNTAADGSVTNGKTIVFTVDTSEIPSNELRV